MRQLSLFIAFFLWIFSSSLFASQLIIEPDMGRAPLLNAINSTQHSLDLVMYGFTDQPLLDAIIAQKNRGRTVKIILEGTPYKAENENAKAIAKFNTNHIDWRGSIKAIKLIHQKTLIIDDKKAIVMTFNFTHSSFKNERNFALIVDDPNEVNEIAAIFSADWNQVATSSHSSHLLVSPDDSRQKLLMLIADAKISIRIYAQNINDYKIVGALARAARRGVKVEIITSSKMREKQADYLARANIAIRIDKALYIHAKVMIFDHQKAVIGSINLTRSSFDQNRELAIVTEDADVIKQLSNTFNHDWNNTEHVANHAYHFSTDQRTVLHAAKFIKHMMKPIERLMRENARKMRSL